MTDEMPNIVQDDLMNENQTICWHYILDIHQPHEIWYSVHIMENDLYEPDGNEIL